MADTYTQLLVQIIFAVKGRDSLVKEYFRQRLEQYISGIVAGKKSKMLAIYCNPDHCHVLIGLHPSVSVSVMARDIKSDSSTWINHQRFLPGRFAWQKGYGAFTYSRSQLDGVVKYILRQPEHHKKKTFREEYLEFLDKFSIEHQEQNLFEFFD